MVMISNGSAPYDGPLIRLSPFPIPEDCGGGWWRKTWEVQTDPCQPLTGLHVPALDREIEDRPLLVAVLPQGPGRILVDVLTTVPQIMDEEIVYTAFVLQAIRSSFRQITINGDGDHTILHMATVGG